MPANKDQKRITRARMRKTGESYTAARAAVLARAPYAVPRKDWPALAGFSDATMREKTGRTWIGWVNALDERNASELPHGRIATTVGVIDPAVSGWWRQAITVGYERIRGLRAVGQGRDGTYRAGKSKTLPVAVATVFAMFADGRKRKSWMASGITRVRTTVENRSVRADWADGTQVNVFFTVKGPQKTVVTIEHVNLARAEDVERAKAEWADLLARLERRLV